MRRTFLAAVASAAIVFTACTSGGGGSSPGAESPAASASGGASPSASSAFDPNSVSGDVVLSGWQASAEEGAALDEVLAAFKEKYPNINVKYEPVAGDYPAAMTAKFSAQEPPDVFYVDSSVAPEWIDEGVLEDLEPLATERGFDTAQFYEGYLDAFKGPQGGIYGFPKDGNTLALAYNSDMLSAVALPRPMPRISSGSTVCAVSDWLGGADMVGSQ